MQHLLSKRFKVSISVQLKIFPKLKWNHKQKFRIQVRILSSKGILKSVISAVLVASGPFFTSDSLSNDPLTELVSNVKELKPNLTLLMAPFLDERHPSVKKEPSKIS